MGKHCQGQIEVKLDGGSAAIRLELRIFNESYPANKNDEKYEKFIGFLCLLVIVVTNGSE